MLRNLTICDFVIVDRAELEFGAGFTALTGETGAGKSILIDALALALGERADAGVVRAGCERAEIAAEFDAAPALQEWLAANDLAGDEGVCLIRRIIEASGRSRGFVNGRSATMQQLREAGEFLLDIHGQHQHQSLLRGAAQRDLLDAYAGLGDAAAQVAAAFRAWQELRRRREACDADAARFAAEREQLEWQARELAALDFQADEWLALNAEHARLSHAAALIEAAQYGLEALEDGEAACLARLHAAETRLAAALEFDAALREALDFLGQAQIQTREAVYALRRYRERIELDPDRLQEAEQRIAALHSAARKYRVSAEQLPEVLRAARERLAQLGGDLDTAELLRREQAAQREYLALAQKLSEGRKSAAQRLSQQVSAAMQTLAMAGGRFEVCLAGVAEGSAHGLEQIEFRVAAHDGMTPGALARVASGGELSRISLAIQTVTSQVAQVPTLIFDEVDSGIGGKVAEIVGRMLKQLGARHQVMCVTHLPQVAAAAGRQWQVAKSVDGGAAASRVTVLDGRQRVEEIARMLGGVKITETTRKHAEEMLGLHA